MASSDARARTHAWVREKKRQRRKNTESQWYRWAKANVNLPFRHILWAFVIPFFSLLILVSMCKHIFLLRIHKFLFGFFIQRAYLYSLISTQIEWFGFVTCLPCMSFPRLFFFFIFLFCRVDVCLQHLIALGIFLWFVRFDAGAFEY